MKVPIRGFHELLMLGRWDANGIKKKRRPAKHLDQRMITKRREVSIKSRPLLIHITGLDNTLKPFAVKARERMCKTYESTYESVAIQIAGKHVNTTAQKKRAFPPILARFSIEASADVFVVGLAVGPVFGNAEETEESFVGWQV